MGDGVFVAYAISAALVLITAIICASVLISDALDRKGRPSR